MENPNICSECGGEMEYGILDREYVTKDKTVLIRGIECMRCTECKHIAFSEREDALVEAIYKASL